METINCEINIKKQYTETIEYYRVQNFQGLFICILTVERVHNILYTGGDSILEYIWRGKIIIYKQVPRSMN